MFKKYIKSTIRKNVLSDKLIDSTLCRLGGCNVLNLYSYVGLENSLRFINAQSNLIKKIIIVNSIVTKIRASRNVNNTLKQLKFLSLLLYQRMLFNIDLIPEKKLLDLKDHLLRQLPGFFWFTCNSNSRTAIDRLYFDKFATKMGINLLQSTFLDKFLLKNTLNSNLLKSVSVSDVYLFFSKIFSKNFDLDVLSIPSNSLAIYRLQKLSLELDYKISWFSCIRFLKPSFQICQNKLSLKRISLAEDYILPYAYLEKTNYELIKSNLLPFFRQDSPNTWSEDNYGYSKNIAQDSLVKPEKIIFLFNIGQSIIRFFKKSKTLKLKAFLPILSFNLNIVPEISRFQKMLFIERFFLHLLHEKLNFINYIQENFYVFFCKPLHNLLKLLGGFAIILLIYPYKILVDAENCAFFFGYSLLFFILAHTFLLVFKFWWYFFTGRIQSSKTLDIDIDVIIFISVFITLPLSIFGELIYNPRSPFLILKKWYIKTLL